MPTIDTLIPDIQHLVTRKDGWFDEQVSRVLAQDISVRVSSSFSAPQRATLRMSGLGPRCPRALWFSIHHPELAQALPPWAEVKFAFGNVIEALALTLAKEAGHDVQGEQDELYLDGVKGHRDAVIDGCTVDVKSCSSRTFEKLRLPRFDLVDSFGYLDQLDGYVVASADDPLVTVKDRGYLFGIDKTLGHMVLYRHDIRNTHIRNRIAEYKRIVSLADAPDCLCRTRPEGKSGNIQLDTKASYEPFKFCCFPRLRTFIYSKGPVYLTHVAREPNVPELDRYGRLIHSRSQRVLTNDNDLPHPLRGAG